MAVTPDRRRRHADCLFVRGWRLVDQWISGSMLQHDATSDMLAWRSIVVLSPRTVIYWGSLLAIRYRPESWECNAQTANCIVLYILNFLGKYPCISLAIVHHGCSLSSSLIAVARGIHGVAEVKEALAIRLGLRAGTAG